MPPRIRNNSHVAGRGISPDTITRDPAIAIPQFPLSDPKPAELSYWDELWNTHPLNGWWVKRGVERELAMYVRLSIRCETSPTAPLLAQLRGARSDLGLSAVGARNLGLVYSLGEAGDSWDDFVESL